jgi:hypothetical protein
MRGQPTRSCADQAAQKKRRSEDRRQDEARSALLFLSLRGQTFKREAKQFADARVFLLRVTLQHRTLLGCDPHRNLTMGHRVRLASLEVEIFHSKADNFTGRLKAVTITSRFDLGDESQRKIKRQWGGAFLCASGHNSKAAGGWSSAQPPPHTYLRIEQRKFWCTDEIDAFFCQLLSLMISE